MTRGTSIVLISILAVVLIAGAGALWWLTRPSRAEVLVRRAVQSKLASLAGATREDRELLEFYGRRGKRAAWSDGRTPRPEAADFIGMLEKIVPLEGLAPQRYEAEALRLRMDELERGVLRGLLPEPERLADLDLALSRDFLRLASELHDGRVPDSTLDPGWVAARGHIDPVKRLERALRDHTVELYDLPPWSAEYVRLGEALVRYRGLASAGGWPELDPGPVLTRGAAGARVLELRRRLALEGDSCGGGREFDAALARAVRTFQARHGLFESGIVDSATRAALNVGASERVRQIELNLERWRWLPRTLPEPCVIVNLPAFALEVRDSGRVLIRSRVVVGEARNPTPCFSAVLSYLVINPTWRVPKRILVEETLPALARDTSWLAKHQMRVLYTHARTLTETPIRAVDWTTVEDDTFPYLVIQDPGDENPLGRIKLMCPNPHDVYLHDTPLKGYFSAAARAYSHGCVRVEKAREIADWLLARDTLLETQGLLGLRTPRVPDLRDSLAAAIESLATRTVGLKHRVPVHFLYWTAWVDSSGAVQFRDDLYGIDHRLDQALRTGEVAGFVLNPPLEWGEKHRGQPADSASVSRLGERVMKALGVEPPQPVDLAKQADPKKPGVKPPVRR